MDVINRSEPLERTAQVRTTLKVKMYAHTLSTLSVNSYHFEFNVSSSSLDGVSWNTSHPLGTSLLALLFKLIVN